MSKAVASNLVPLVVTTLHKGVFFGWGLPTREKIIVLEKVQMCIYWSPDVRGVFGLAAGGPNNGCKISPAVPEMTIQDVTAIAKATPEAAEAWEKEAVRKWA
jgi:hypothetical protein